MLLSQGRDLTICGHPVVSFKLLLLPTRLLVALSRPRQHLMLMFKIATDVHNRSFAKCFGSHAMA